MKLELKYLAPYLPYGLQCKTKDKSGQIWTLGCENIQHAIQWWQPILKPIHTITDKQLEQMGWVNKPNGCTLNELLQDHVQRKLYDVSDYDFLISNHFDVFGLIKAGLAIDINTLNNQ